MSVPTKYDPSYSYSGFESVNPASPKPGAQLDNDFSQIGQSISETIDALGNIRRSDGALANKVVGTDQLSDTLVLGFTLRGGWATATAYKAGDGVTYGNTFYKANLTHTSAPGTRPDLDPLTWTFLLTFSAIALTDGSVTPIKLDATAAAGFRNVIGQEESVAEGVANVTTKATPVDADKLPLVDSENSGNLRGLTFGALATWVGAKLGPLIAAQTGKTTPVDGDTFGIADSEASSATKSLSWSGLKAGVWAALGALTAGGTSKVTPVDADTLPMSDSAASSATKKLTWANLKATLQAFFDTRYLQSSAATAAASAAQQETGTATNVYVAPGTQHRHPSAAKAWGVITGGSTSVLSSGYNVASITDNGNTVTVTLTTPFSSTNYVVVATSTGSSNDDGVATVSGKTTNSFVLTRYDVSSNAGSVAPGIGWDFVCFGDQ